VQCGSRADLQNIEHRLGADALYALHRTCPLSAPTFVEEIIRFVEKALIFRNSLNLVFIRCRAD